MKMYLPLLLILTACGATVPSIDSPSAVATDASNAAVRCGTGAGLYGHGNVVFVHTERASLASGKLTVSADCTVTIEAGMPVK